MLAAILAAACGYRVSHSRIRVPDAHACHIRMQAAPPAADGGEVLLSASGLAQTFDGQRYPFRDIELTLARGAKVGLVGANGVGKSSLLKVLVGADAPESGDVRLTKDVQLAYVEQDPTLPDGALAEEFFYGSELPGFAALREFGAAAAEVEEGGDDAAAARLARASDAMDERAWALESEMKKLCEVLRVRSLLRTPASALSGGQRKRLALAAALLARPDLLLLDEPTNHLDIEGIGWLEKELSSMRDTAVLLVTHDRAFLSAVANEMFELHGSSLWRHRGTYEEFLDAKQARLEAQGQQAAAARNLYRRELAWVRKQPKARESKSKSRLERFEELKSTVNAAPTPTQAVELEAGMQRLGTSILRFEKARCKRGELTVLDDFSYDFSRGDRIGLVGPNGAGKSSFLLTILQQLPLESGRVIAGETLVYGHYSQEGLELDDAEMRVLAFEREAVAVGHDAQRGDAGRLGAEEAERRAGQLLRQFLFPQHRWATPVGRLSGGERRRLQLLSVLAKEPNVLLLDEPTNDLDLDTLAVLEDFLLGFKGVLLVVSHDRYFVDKVCDQLFVLGAGGDGDVRRWPDSFTQWVEWKRREEEEQKAAPPPPSSPAPPAPPPPPKAAESSKPLSAFEERELASLEAKIEELTEAEAALQTQINGFDADRNGYSELEEWTAELDALGAKLATTEEKWLALAERA